MLLCLLLWTFDATWMASLTLPPSSPVLKASRASLEVLLCRGCRLRDTRGGDVPSSSFKGTDAVVALKVSVKQLRQVIKLV